MESVRVGGPASGERGQQGPVQVHWAGGSHILPSDCGHQERVRTEPAREDVHLRYSWSRPCPPTHDRDLLLHDPGIIGPITSNALYPSSHLTSQ